MWAPRVYVANGATDPSTDKCRWIFCLYNICLIFTRGVNSQNESMLGQTVIMEEEIK